MMLVAMAVILVVILASAAAISGSVNSVTQFGITNKQVSSIDASEAGIQFELNAMNKAVTTSTSTFTCLLSTNLGPALPYQASYHLMYGVAVGTTAPTVANLACAGTVTLTAGDTYLFQSTGTTTSVSVGSRTTQAVIYVPAASTTTGSAFDQTFFENSAEVMPNGMAITAGANAGALYVNGNWTCQTQQTIAGTVTVYGTSALSQACTITGNLYSSGALSFHTGANVSGWTETPAAFTGPDPNQNNKYSGLLYAASWTSTLCGSASNDDFNSCTVYSGSTAPTPIAAETFPSIPYNSSAASPWGASWTVDNDTSCNPNDLVTDAVAGASTILYWPSICGILTAPSNQTAPVSNNLAIIAPGGVNFYNESNPFSATSAHSVYVIVPSSVTASGTTSTTTCSGGSPMIQANSSVTFDSDLNVLLYDPCNIQFSNGINAMTGQIYAGGTFTKGGNAMAMTGVQMSVTGASGGGLVVTAGSSAPVLTSESQAANPSGYK
jgi:hypothetical protein